MKLLNKSLFPNQLTSTIDDKFINIQRELNTHNTWEKSKNQYHG